MEADYIRLKEIKPELAGYLTDSLQLMSSSAFPSDDAVHDIRVLLKKSRAALSLIGSQVITDFNRKDIQSLKEAAGIMSDWRDNTVLRKTLKDIKKDYPLLFEKLKDHAIISSLITKTDHQARKPKDYSASSERMADLIRKTAFRIRFQNTSSMDAIVLLKELEKSYITAAERFLTCRLNPSRRNLHDFRKKSKKFLYQLFFFRPLDNQVKTLEKKLEEMTRDLGKVNDLWNLFEALDYKSTDRSVVPEMDELAIRIREEQDKYLQRIWNVASKIFFPGKKLVSLLGYKILVI